MGMGLNALAGLDCVAVGMGLGWVETGIGMIYMDGMLMLQYGMECGGMGRTVVAAWDVNVTGSGGM